MPPHCDTKDGPVVTKARQALKENNVNLVLPWIPEEGEEEVKEAFEKTVEVRTQGEKARELADYWFFETCVRVHRMGEGVGFTGIKPSGLSEGAAVEVADKSLESGEVEAVIGFLSEKIENQIRESYQLAVQKRGDYENVLERDARSRESVRAGRKWVEAYIHYVHLVKGIHDATSQEEK